MDWAKVKLTADDFERGTINVAKGTTLDTQKDGDTWTSHWRTKNLVKIDKAINIPIKSGYKYYLCFYDSSGTYINNHSFRSYAETIKGATVLYMAMVIAKNDESAMEQTEISNALPGYIWTAGQPEFGKLKDGSVYTKGRNLLKNSSSGFTFSGSDIASNIRTEPGKLTLLKAGHTNAYKVHLINIDDTEKITQQADDLVFGLDIKTTGIVSNHSFAIDIRNTDHSQMILGSRAIITPDLNGKWQRIYSVIKGVEKRPWILPCFDFPNVQGSEIGATIEYKNWSLMYGDEYYPWSSAPEDVDNPTEAV